MSQNVFILFFISLIFSTLVGIGIYGYGIDYHGLYSRPNLNMGDYRNWLGYRLSSLTIFDRHIGAFLLSLILSFSVSLLIYEYFKEKLINSIIYVLFIAAITFHTWPIIMSATNAMRQGFANSLVFLGFVLIFQKNYKLSFILFIASLFLHKTGFFFLAVFLCTYLFKSTLSLIKENQKFIFLLCSSLLLILFIYFIYLFYLNTSEEFRIIHGDFRIPFLIINISYIITYICLHDFMKKNDINLFLFIFSCAAIPVLLIGYNWQYERLNMMMLIPYILSIGNLFNRRSAMFFWALTISLLLLLTIYQGMYNALVDEYTFKQIRGL